MRLGFVLPNIPAYSETFFVSKIKGLAASGIDIIVFASNKQNHINYLQPESGKGLVKIVQPYKVVGSVLLQVLKTIGVLLLTCIKTPRHVRRFIALERADGFSTREIIERLYINAHILPYHLDWLHFGFATMGVQRENVAKAIGAKSAVSFRGYDINVYPLKHTDCYRKLFATIDKVHAISDSLYKRAVSLGLPIEKNYLRITPAIKVSDYDLDRSVLIKNNIRILTVGRLTWVKGYEYALETIALLKKMGLDINYTIIGDGEDRERLTFAAYQWDIADRVRFVGKQSQEVIAQYMRESDIYIQASVQEGFCNAVLEAQAAGLLCVVTDAEGLTENVLNGLSGFVVPKRNPQAMACKIREVWELPVEEKIKITQFAIERVKKEFEIKDQIRKFIQFYT